MLRTEARARVVVHTTTGTWKGQWFTAEKLGSMTIMKKEIQSITNILKNIGSLDYLSLTLNGDTMYFNPAQVVYAKIEKRGCWDEYEV